MKDAAQKQVDSTAGANLLKTLGIANATAERADDGLNGLRLGAIADYLPAKYAGLQQGDLLLGVNGWNVNDNLDLGRASRGYAVAPVKYLSSSGAPNPEGPVPPNVLVALVSRRDPLNSQTKMLLFEIKPPDAPVPPPDLARNAKPSTKPTDQGVSPGKGFHNRRRPGEP
jgi:hypothetical protein